jgi:hypothetical protein
MKKNSLLIRTIIDNNRALAKKLIASGSDVNKRGVDNTTAIIECVRDLHISKADDAIEIIDLLLENGADIDAEDNSGRTALIIAKHNGLDVVVEHLLEKGSEDLGPRIYYYNFRNHLPDIMSVLYKHYVCDKNSKFNDRISDCNSLIELLWLLVPEKGCKYYFPTETPTNSDIKEECCSFINCLSKTTKGEWLVEDLVFLDESKILIKFKSFNKQNSIQFSKLHYHHFLDRVLHYYSDICNLISGELLVRNSDTSASLFYLPKGFISEVSDHAGITYDTHKKIHTIT